MVAVAASGGRDSTALLHATAHQAARAGIDVLALHVHHGLQPAADDWVAHLTALCRRWARKGLPLRLQVHRLTEVPAPGDSIEAWARRQRYQALGAMARAGGAGVVLLAHHQRDQAETFLLQALRGAGAAGLAAMPAQMQRDGLTWARPWLGQPEAAIAAYARRHRLRWIEDPSNADDRHARSRLRTRVMPLLRNAFADADAALAQASGGAAQARACLDDLAAADLAAIGARPEAWPVPAGLTLPPHRLANALQAWLRTCLGRGAPQALVARLMAELPGRATGRWPAPGGELRLYRTRLSFAATAAAPVPVASTAKTDVASTAPSALALVVHGPSTVPLSPWRGRFVFADTPSGGLSVAALASAEARARCGGERFQAQPGSVPRALKKQFQSAGVPAWQRNAPLLYCQGRLAFVPGLGIDARCRAAPGEAQLAVDWLPAA